MKSLCATLMAMLIATPALALSCLRPDAVHLYESARDSEDPYLIVRGRIDLLEAPNDPTPESDDQAITRATVNGVALDAYRFGSAFVREIDIVASCLGPWCGSAAGYEGELILALRSETDGRYSLAAGPCGGLAVNWSQSGEQRLLACHRDGVCALAEE